MKKLMLLHEDFIKQAKRPMFGGLPITPKMSEVPVFPMERWQDVDGTIIKRYQFRRPADRDRFILTLLQYEADVQHHADLHVKEGSVQVSLFTKDLDKVTEIDREYATFSDMTYRDIVYSPDGEDEATEQA